MKYYKLTDEKNQTRDGTQWGEGITHKAKGKGKELCSADVIHVYDHPLKAVMFNPAHANFTTPHLWEVKVKDVVANDSLKGGVKSCTTIREIPLPEITIEQRVRFAIYCALEVYSDEKFVKWANTWLNGTDRSVEAAWAARSASGAAWAARSAARSAESAARSAWSARSAAESAESAARSAAESAESAEIDFVRLIKKAMKETEKMKCEVRNCDFEAKWKTRKGKCLCNKHKTRLTPFEKKYVISL